MPQGHRLVPRPARRVRAAFFAAAARSRGPFVRTAFPAAADRLAALRRAAAAWACRDRARCEAAARGLAFRARLVALARFAEGRAPARFPRPSSYAASALRRVFSEVLPGAGGGRSTPARRAFDSPMAIACCAELAPCFPSRMWWISSRTNLPAWVLGALPPARSLRALLRVSSLGISMVPFNVRLGSSRGCRGRGAPGEPSAISRRRPPPTLRCRASSSRAPPSSLALPWPDRGR